MRLYHGTSERHVKAILRDGIKPRGKRNKGNWTRSVESNADCVYLTSAYAIYFAGNAAKDGERLAVVEVDTARLNFLNLLPDEDFLEQSSRVVGPAPLDRSMKTRTRWYRQRLDEFQQYWMTSVEKMGTCCHRGIVPREALTRVAFLDHDLHMKLVFHGMDPMITPANFKICGPKYRNYTAWLFGDPLEKDPSVWDPTPEALAAMGLTEDSPIVKQVRENAKFLISRETVEVKYL